MLLNGERTPCEVFIGFRLGGFHPPRFRECFASSTMESVSLFTNDRELPANGKVGEIFSPVSLLFSWFQNK